MSFSQSKPDRHIELTVRSVAKVAAFATFLCLSDFALGFDLPPTRGVNYVYLRQLYGAKCDRAGLYCKTLDQGAPVIGAIVKPTNPFDLVCNAKEIAPGRYYPSDPVTRSATTETFQAFFRESDHFGSLVSELDSSELLVEWHAENVGEERAEAQPDILRALRTTDPQCRQRSLKNSSLRMVRSRIFGRISLVMVPGKALPVSKFEEAVFRVKALISEPYEINIERVAGNRNAVVIRHAVPQMFAVELGPVVE